MRIVNIEDFFHPNAGYQINILPKYMVKKGIDTYIITSEMEKVPDNLTKFFGKNNIEEYDKQYEEMTGVKIIRIPVKGFLSNRAIFTKELYKKVDELAPDIVYVHGNDTLVGMKYIWNQRKLSYALISDSHMLEMASVNKFNKVFRKFYKIFITPKIIKNKLTIIRTQDDAYVNRCLGIPLEQAPWVSYGSDTLLFHPDEKMKVEFKKENKIPENAFIVLYAGKLDESKGGMFLAEAVNEKFQTDKDVVFVIVGNSAGDYGEKLEDCLKNSQNKILRFPTQRYVDLAPFFQSADLVVFPKQCSLSFYDVQACGVPVLSEDNNINIERCSHKNGFVFESGNMDDFRRKIVDCINMPSNKYKEIKINAYDYITQNYNYSNKADEYIREINSSLRRFEENNGKNGIK